MRLFPTNRYLDKPKMFVFKLRKDIEICQHGPLKKKKNIIPHVPHGECSNNHNISQMEEH